tara:strand:- start:1312 stop:2580 length:1269 start_codon:yes stop_codon:yes gene_type:complete
MIRCLLLMTLFSITSLAFAGADVAKVIIVRGSAMAKNPDGSVIQIKQGMWFKEGTQVKTEDKSFVKLLFIDKSQMNLGPNSQMKIDTFPESDAGIVTLVKGQLRSKVSKNYMDMDKKDKSKLFIKTKTAAMGVRGTDFQVNYNPENNFTSLVTFEGAVAMASISEFGLKAAEFVDQSKLERLVSSDQAVTVTRGQFSGASPETGSATIPVKINPMQLENMEKDVSGTAEAAPAEVSAAPKPVKSIVPPGVNGASFSNKAKVDTQVGAKVSISGYADNKKVNTAAAGAVVDVGTGKLLLPPKNAPIDKNTGVPMITGTAAVLGGGGKINLAGVKNINVVVVDLPTANKVAVAAQISRGPASIAPKDNPLLAPKQPAPGTTAAGEPLVGAAQDVLADTQENIVDSQDLGTGITRTKVNFNLSVQ